MIHWLKKLCPFKWRKDGGPESHVTMIGFEIKWLFSVLLLRFGDGSREAYHSHAFNSRSLLLTGRLEEWHTDGRENKYLPGSVIRTPRHTFHKVYSFGTSWVLTLRGPWSKYWYERDERGVVTILGPGRVVIGEAGASQQHFGEGIV